MTTHDQIREEIRDAELEVERCREREREVREGDDYHFMNKSKRERVLAEFKREREEAKQVLDNARERLRRKLKGENVTT